MPKKGYWFLFLFITIITSQCRRIDVKTQQESWSIDTAKEWWFGFFKKSPQYREINSSSPYAIALAKAATSGGSNILTEKSTIKKYPVWDLGELFNTGKFQAFEFPLLYPNKCAPMPEGTTLSGTAANRIAESILNKVVLIRSQAGDITVRVVSIIPEYEYAQKKQFDISNNSMKHLDPEFKGWIVVRKWNEEIINIYETRNGKITRVLNMKTRQIRSNGNTSNRSASEICGYAEVVIWNKVCIAEPCEPPQEIPCINGCAEWYYEPQLSWDWVCVDGSNNIDCLQSAMPYEQCMCYYYNLDCDGSGDGGGGYFADTPCSVADSLEHDAGLRRWCDTIRGTVPSRRERSIYMVNQNGEYLVAIDTVGNPDSLGAPDINLPTGLKLDAVAHDHFYRSGQSLNTFTPLDLFSLGILWKEQHINNTRSFAYFLSTPHDATLSLNDYCIVISDSASFADFISPIVNAGNGFYLLELEYMFKDISENNSAAANEKNLLTLFSQKNTGLTLLKRDISGGTGKWEPRKLQNDQVISIPCD